MLEGLGLDTYSCCLSVVGQGKRATCMVGGVNYS
jgi:hypothetical protein